MAEHDGRLSNSVKGVLSLKLCFPVHSGKQKQKRLIADHWLVETEPKLDYLYLNTKWPCKAKRKK